MTTATAGSDAPATFTILDDGQRAIYETTDRDLADFIAQQTGATVITTPALNFWLGAE